MLYINRHHACMNAYYQLTNVEWLKGKENNGMLKALKKQRNNLITRSSKNETIVMLSSCDLCNQVQATVFFVHVKWRRIFSVMLNENYRRFRLKERVQWNINMLLLVRHTVTEPDNQSMLYICCIVVKYKVLKTRVKIVKARRTEQYGCIM